MSRLEECKSYMKNALSTLTPEEAKNLKNNIKRGIRILCGKEAMKFLDIKAACPAALAGCHKIPLEVRYTPTSRLCDLPYGKEIMNVYRKLEGSIPNGRFYYALELLKEEQIKEIIHELFG